MYKCKECGEEYDIKPEYCNCGNDEFDVVDFKTDKPESPQTQDEIIINEPIVSNDREKFIESTHKSYQKYTPISLVAFVVCIILAVIIMLIPVKEREIVSSETATVIQNIPAIDKIWNDSVFMTEKEVLDMPVTSQVVSQKVVQKPVAKLAQRPTTTVKPQAVAVRKDTTSVSKAEDELRKAEAAKRLAEVKKQAEDLQQAMSDKMEYANYKAKLRNTLGQKIDFTKVIGDGDCIISFKIDQTGRLINGAFAKQSSNITLNNAVYSAFMNSRNFTPPPAFYNNEILKLHVKFYNGNFEISLN